MFFSYFLPSLYTLVFSWTENSTLASVLFCCFYFHIFISFNIGFSETQYMESLELAKQKTKKKKSNTKRLSALQRVVNGCLFWANCNHSELPFLTELFLFFKFLMGFLYCNFLLQLDYGIISLHFSRLIGIFTTNHARTLAINHRRITLHHHTHSSHASWSISLTVC